MRGERLPEYRPCVFCGKTDSPPSREHVLAKWISREFPDTASWEIENLVTGTKFSDHQISLVTRKPCKRCNEGWMCQLEGAVKPILVPLMKGEQLTLTPNWQLLIVRWFAKTVMAHEFLDKGPYYFQPDERHALESALIVPSPTLFFLGHYAGPKPASTYAVHIPLTAGADTDGPTRIEGYSATFTIKQLAMQVFSLRVPPALPFDNIGWQLPPTIAMMADQIWPITTDNLHWPPPFYLQGEDLDVFKDRWVTSLLGPTN